MAVERYDALCVGRKNARRWDERTPPESVAPETAWREGWHVAPPRPEYHHVDEIRYYHPERIALVRSNATLEQVLNMTGPQTEKSIVLQKRIEKQFGIAFEDLQKIQHE